MEEPHFIKCEPKWSPDTEEFLRPESEDYFLPGNLTRVKTESIHSSDPELKVEEGNRDSFSECETQILKEEIIKEEEDINRRNPLDDDLDLPAASAGSSLNIQQESAQDMNFSNDLKCEGETNYPCLQCDEVFRSGANLETHINDTHMQNGAYKCNECNKLFTWHQNLWDHLKTHHGKKSFQCTLCEKAFLRSSDLRRHTVVVHSGKYKCNECDRLFTWRQNLWDHMKTHRGKKSFQCTLCEKAFLRSSDLRRHMVVHTGKRSFECSLCGKTFNLAGNLKHHIKLHSGARPYSCSTCNMAFRSKGNLTKHAMTHTQVRPFSCEQCGKAFLEAANLKKHLRLHSTEHPR